MPLFVDVVSIDVVSAEKTGGQYLDRLLSTSLAMVLPISLYVLLPCLLALMLTKLVRRCDDFVFTRPRSGELLLVIGPESGELLLVIGPESGELLLVIGPEPILHGRFI